MENRGLEEEDSFHCADSADFRTNKIYDGIDGSKAGRGLQTTEHLRFYGCVGDAVQIQKCLRVRENDGTQLFPTKCAALHRAGKTGFDGGKKIFVGLQQLMVDGIAIQNQAALPGDQIQKCGFAAAGAAGDANDHASSSASTMWKAAAFFRRFCTA